MKDSIHSSVRLRQLDELYEEVRANILDRQHPITGLLPASTAVNAHGDYTDAWVRDNVYSIMSVWALSLAYRRVDTSDSRAYELEQSTVKNMRGLLLSMMRQANKVERFKRSQNPHDALHAKYDTATGLTVVGDEDWGHLQLDATSLFVLMLVQMTLGGLRIINNRDEVAFVQNLVWYLSRAYCTPDYGIWERGNKINHGQRELNASSIGMVLAALQAVDDFDLFGGDGDDTTRIRVLADDIARTEITLHALLPRESGSKEVDAALLSIIGYPAFAVRDAGLVHEVDQAIITKLSGRYGCKRFLRDGHQTVLEDESKLHYEPFELEAFAGIESEWPLFITYMLINRMFAGDRAAAARYNQRLSRLGVLQDGNLLLPELYYVPREDVELERYSPGSVDREPNENQPLVWAQSLWLVGRLLLEGAIDMADLDPIGRRLIVGHEVQRGVSVALLAENGNVGTWLENAGLSRYAVIGDSRVQIGSARALVENLVDLGASVRLDLSGRPRRRVLGLTTARVYEIEGERWLIVPQLFDTDDFYLVQDLALLVQEIRSTIGYLHHHWRQPGRPIFTILVSEWMLEAEDNEVLLDFLRDELAGGWVDQAPVHLDRVESLVARGNRVRLPGSMAGWAPRPLMAVQPAEQNHSLAQQEKDALQPIADAMLIQRHGASHNLYERVEILSILLRRHGHYLATSFEDAKGRHHRLSDYLEVLFRTAQRSRLWSVMRRSAELLGKVDAHLEVALMDVIVRQKHLAVGRSYTSDALIAEPLSNREILDRIHRFCGDDERERILTQELIVHLGGLLRAEPELFDNVITLRVGPLLQTLISLFARDEQIAPGVAFDRLMELPPHVISERLREAMNWRGGASMLEALHLVETDVSLDTVRFSAGEDPESDQTDWNQWRRVHGAVGRLPGSFYEGIWALLAHTPALVIGDRYNPKNSLDSALYRSQSTPGEKNFAVAVEHVLNRIAAPEYRELVNEALYALMRVTSRNPSLQFREPLIIDVLIGHAVRLAWLTDHPENAGNYDEVRDQAWAAFYHRPPHQVANFVTEALGTLLGAGESRDIELLEARES